MRSFSCIPLVVALLTLVFPFYVGSSILCAQPSRLKGCSETLSKNRQEITERKSTIPQSLFPALNPTYQKLQQTYKVWAECVKGQKAPLSSYKTLTGEVYDKASLAGKVIVINFWFMNCGPCRAEMPALNKLVEEYKGRNVLFLGLSPDKAERITPAFFKQNRFDFTIIPDCENAASLFYITGYPTTYIVDQQGIIRQAWVGFMEADLNKLTPYYQAKTAIDQLLATASK